jgi:hypothetical protein
MVSDLINSQKQLFKIKRCVKLHDISCKLLQLLFGGTLFS